MRILSAFISAALATSALAQAPAGNYEWQVSTDGATWSNIAAFFPATTYHVRLLASWTGIVGTDMGYAGSQFDAIILGATAASTISNIQRPPPFAFAAQTLVATTYGGGANTKIDTSVDTSPPGTGTGWVNPGQAAKDFAASGTYNSNNPCVVFSYDIVPADMVTISVVLNTVTGRAMAVFTNSSGTQTRLSSTAVTITNASIIIPGPGAISVICLSSMGATRRRR